MKILLSFLLIFSFLFSSSSLDNTEIGILINDNITLEEAMYITSTVAKEQNTSFRVTLKFNANINNFGYIVYPKSKRVIIQQRLNI
jgi:hypothetical protein